MDDQRHGAAGRLKALGHPVRLGIAMRLGAQAGTCARGLAQGVDVSQPTISQHLRVLREAGLVTTRRRGTQICYSLDAGGVRAVQAALAELATPALRSA